MEKSSYSLLETRYIKDFYKLGFQDDEMGKIVDLVAEYLEYFGEDEL